MPEQQAGRECPGGRTANEGLPRWSGLPRVAEPGLETQVLPADSLAGIDESKAATERACGSHNFGGLGDRHARIEVRLSSRVPDRIHNQGGRPVELGVVGGQRPSPQKTFISNLAASFGSANRTPGSRPAVAGP